MPPDEIVCANAANRLEGLFGMDFRDQSFGVTTKYPHTGRDELLCH